MRTIQITTIIRKAIDMKALNEQLLDVWLHLSVVINNERVVSDVPYNESLICNILYRNQLQDPGHLLTATDLCDATRMLKSQMNRTLNSMEEKGFISRERSRTDKRLVYVHLNREHTKLYEQQHSQILNKLDTLIERIGEEKTQQTISLLEEIATISKEVFK